LTYWTCMSQPNVNWTSGLLVNYSEILLIQAPTQRFEQPPPFRGRRGVFVRTHDPFGSGTAPWSQDHVGTYSKNGNKTKTKKTKTSLTTVVRAESDTSKTANITEHFQWKRWYYYSNRHFGDLLHLFLLKNVITDICCFLGVILRRTLTTVVFNINKIYRPVWLDNALNLSARAQVERIRKYKSEISF